MSKNFLDELKPKEVKQAEERAQKELEERIREIVREEIAAHKEQPEVISPISKLGEITSSEIMSLFGDIINRSFEQ